MYERAATTLKEEGEPAVLAKVDGTLNEELADRLGIDSYPAFLFYA